ncbi:MAG: hypothetical protein AB7V25_04915 [Mangrovibacterium sp.]
MVDTDQSGTVLINARTGGVTYTGEVTGYPHTTTTRECLPRCSGK